MTGPAAPAQGWCPSTHRIHRAGDGGLARVRVPGGVLDGVALRAVAGAARDLGSGVVELTVRANLQVRGLDPDAGPALRARLRAAGLGADDPEVEDRLNVLASPTAGVADDEVADVTPLVAVVGAALAATAPSPLPHKVGVLLDGGGSPSLRGIAHDLALGARAGPDGRPRLEVALGRALDAVAPAERRVLADPGPEAVARLVTAVARRCATGVAGRPARMAAIAGAADDPTGADPPRPAASTPTVPVPGPGLHPSRRTGTWWLWVRPRAGPVRAGHLEELADLADGCGEGTVRLTPWRGVVVAGLTDPDRVRAALAATGWTAAP